MFEYLYVYIYIFDSREKVSYKNEGFMVLSELFIKNIFTKATYNN